MMASHAEPGSDTNYSHSTLRAANLARQDEWDAGGALDLAYSGNELAGEVGELFEIWTTKGAYTVEGFAEELADVIICIDLIAMRKNFPLGDFGGLLTGHISTEDALMSMMAHVGKACNAIKKIERERHGLRGSRSNDFELRDHLSMSVAYAAIIAKNADFPLDDAVSKKFNATSDKVGLFTRYEPTLH